MRRYVTVTLLALALVGCSGPSSGPSAAELAESSRSRESLISELMGTYAEKSTTQAKPASKVPSGFKTIPGAGDLYGKWADTQSGDCGFYDICWSLDVYSAGGCPRSVYVEISIEDDAGTAVGWTNGTLASLRPDGKGNIIFGATDARGTKARVSEGSCY